MCQSCCAARMSLNQIASKLFGIKCINQVYNASFGLEVERARKQFSRKRFSMRRLGHNLLVDSNINAVRDSSGRNEPGNQANDGRSLRATLCLSGLDVIGSKALLRRHALWAHVRLGLLLERGLISVCESEQWTMSMISAYFTRGSKRANLGANRCSRSRGLQAVCRWRV